MLVLMNLVIPILLFLCDFHSKLIGDYSVHFVTIWGSMSWCFAAGGCGWSLIRVVQMLLIHFPLAIGRPKHHFSLYKFLIRSNYPFYFVKYKLMTKFDFLKLIYSKNNRVYPFI